MQRESQPLLQLPTPATGLCWREGAGSLAARLAVRRRWADALPVAGEGGPGNACGRLCLIMLSSMLRLEGS